MAADAKKGPATKKVTIYRNGDPSFRPVTYTFQPQKTKTFAKLLEEIDRLAPPLRGGGVRSIFTSDGKKKIDTLEAFEAAESTGFVACGTEPYKPVKGGYESIGKSKKDQSKPADANKKQAEAGGKKDKDLEEPAAKREESFLEMNKKKYGDQPRSEDQRLENRVDVGVIKKITIYRNGDQHFKPKQYIYKSKTMRSWEKYLEEMSKIAPPMKGGSVRHVYTMNGEMEVVNFDELEDGEGYVVGGIEGYTTLKNGYESVGKPEGSPRKQPTQQKDKQPRNSEEKLMNRKDQTNPEPAFYFIFKNGHGLEAKRFIFTPKQMDKGMPWLLEQVGKKFNIYAKKLVTMDNRDVFTVNDLESKGAYVVVPLGESFRDTWYYLPALAKDTSADAAQDEKGQQRGGEKEEYGEGNRKERVGRGNRGRRYSDEGDYYDEEYDSRTESGQEYYSDEERNVRRRDGRESMKHNHRPGSNTSYCSYCDMLERHRQKHHYYSDDEDARSPRSRRGSTRPYTAEERYASPPRERSRSRAPTTADRRPQGTSHGRNIKPSSRRQSRAYEEDDEEPYDDEFEEEDYRELSPPLKRQPAQKNNTQLRRAKSEASMISNKNQSRQQQHPSKTNVAAPKKKSNSAGQQQTNKPKSTAYHTNKSPAKGAATPTRSRSQQNLNRSQTNVSNKTNKSQAGNAKTQQKQWK